MSEGKEAETDADQHRHSQQEEHEESPHADKGDGESTEKEEGLTEDLHAAIEQGDISLEQLKQLLSDANDKKKSEALEAAVSGGFSHIVKYLVEELNVNSQNPVFLHIAAREGHLEVLKQGIENYGLDPSVPDDDGNTALHQGCRNAHLDIVRYLVESYGMKPDERKTESGMEAIHVAAEGGYLEIVKYLVDECGVRADTLDEKNFTPLNYASKNSHVETARFLKERTSPQEPAQSNAAKRPNFDALHASSGAKSKTEKNDDSLSGDDKPQFLDVQVEEEPTQLTEVLQKEGYYVKSWKKRLFVLKPSRLLYYDDEDRSKCRGEIELVDIYKVEPKSEQGLFFIHTKKDRTYKICAPSNASRNRWVSALRSAYKGPSRSAQLSREVSRLFHQGIIGEESYNLLNKDIALAETDQELAMNDVRLRVISTLRQDPGLRSKALHDSIRRLKDVRDTTSLVKAVEDLTECCKEEPLTRYTKSEIVEAILDHNKRFQSSIPEEVTTAYQRLFESMNCPEETGSSDMSSDTRKDSYSISINATHLSSEDVIEEEQSVEDKQASEAVRENLLRSISSRSLDDIITPGSFSDRFSTKEHLGTGGYSSVYKALDIESQEDVAVKFVKKADLEETVKYSFFREVKVMKRLDHPNIVRFRAFYDESEFYVLVTELVKGGELFDQIVQKRTYKESEARDVVKTVADAICYMHERGIVHRDLKPENILLDDISKSQSIKIADMGFATVVPKKMLDTPCGSPSYVAPEVLRGRAYNEKVDCWSLGVVTFVLLSGYGPFQDRHPKNQYMKIQQGIYYFDSPYWDRISKAAKDFISKLLVVDPAGRMTAAEMLQHEWVTKTLGHDDLSTAKQRLQELRQEEKRPRFTGNLEKRGKFNRDWKERYFELTGQVLKYSDPVSYELKREIPLRYIKKAKKLDDDVCFEVLTNGGRSFIMRASSLHERDDWVKTINRTIESHLLHLKAENAMDTVENASARQGPEVVSLMNDLRRFQKTDEKIKESLYEEGLAHEQATSGKKNKKLAAEYYERAAKSGHVDAKCRLAGILDTGGEGIKRDPERALKIYREALRDSDCPLDCYRHVGQIYEEGRCCNDGDTVIVASDWKKAQSYYEEAARKNHTPSMLALSSLLQKIGGPEECQRAWNLLLEAAKLKDPEAEYRLWKAYEGNSNFGVKPDDEKASYWFKTALEHDNPHAQYEMGSKYESGTDCSQDMNKAYEWYKKAADTGLARAQYKVAMLLREGVVDESASPREYLDQAETAYPRTVNHMSDMKESRVNAVIREYAEKAAAANDLGGFLLCGQLNLEVDVRKGIRDLSFAAALGSEEAEAELEKVDSKELGGLI
eukprot:gb/GECG01009464.1/.p1 GENE.gb/GECG01009464.1/~~gb/GECG01009464.1/.p1  ORF type:complete len:1344 (+),score=239.98 gb/GECG01009464.1/:1-4032(+)